MLKFVDIEKENSMARGAVSPKWVLCQLATVILRGEEQIIEVSRS